MSNLSKKLMQGAAGAAGGGLSIEDVFSTWLYTGNGSTQTITNGIDLAGEGGLVWIKHRNYANSHQLYDTLRGAGKPLYSNVTNGEGSNPSFTAFTSSGFSLSSAASLDALNGDSSQTYASWTFRKAPGFFDVVTYTGTGSDQTISHNLGSVPGCIIVKRTDATSDWYVYHRSLTTATENWIRLNNSGAANGAIGQDLWGPPTSTTFKVDTYLGLSTSSATYVAYLFAHDEQIFGESGDQSVIKCGSFTTDGSGNATVDLGWEPQFVIAKLSSTTSDWFTFDAMRGFIVQSTGSRVLSPNQNYAEYAQGASFAPTSTGFTIGGGFGVSQTGIYIAIRRGPMKTPTDATEVFDTRALTQAYNTTTPAVSSVTTDLFITGVRNFTHNTWVADRMRGAPHLITDSTGAEAGSNYYKFDAQTGVAFGTSLMASNSVFQYFFRRAPGFFDVVAYTGTGSNPRTINHSLGAVPEFVIVKNRDAVDDWWIYVGSAGITKRLMFNSNSIATTTTTWGNTAFTDQVFGVGDVRTNTSANTYIAYLFATLPGVSKVGSYTGTGTTLDIDCGFTSGARFVLIKRTDSTGDWYVWDTARGIVAGNDPYLLLNSTAAEVTSTDYIDPLSSGFQISSTAPSNINASGASFIFLAIA